MYEICIRYYIIVRKKEIKESIIMKRETEKEKKYIIKTCKWQFSFTEKVTHMTLFFFDKWIQRYYISMNVLVNGKIPRWQIITGSNFWPWLKNSNTKWLVPLMFDSLSGSFISRLHTTLVHLCRKLYP